MKNILKITVLILFFLIDNKIYAQFWDFAVSCNENVNNQELWALGRENVINATFKMDVDGSCTGTLINRNTSDADLGFYFLTARHCLSRDGLNNNNYIDFSEDYVLYFNYQSPDADNNSTPETNRGVTDAESLDPTNSTTILNGYEYRHVSRIRKVADYFWGDFALCEIETPLPPHFNVYYVGWNPSAFYITGIGNSPPCNIYNQYVGVHHPRGDIKKISGANNIQSLETPIANGCYTITTIIDFLFGWIWGHSFSTQVICNYVDNPWYVVPYWCNGTVEGGSSGSGIFNGNNKIFGVLSGAINGCDIQPTTYGKLRSNYSNAAVKQCLNPPNHWWTDQSGMDGRKISCYADLVLPGELGVVGEYFPANHYQDENQITLQANNNISTNSHLRIHNGADYTFRAGNSVTLNPGFTADVGSSFVAEIGACNSQKISSNANEQELFNKLSSIDIPLNKKFNASELKKSDSQKRNYLRIFPNPTNDYITIESNNLINKISIYNDIGIEITNSSNIESNIKEIDLTTQPKGIYLIKLTILNSEVHIYKVLKL